jgi:heptosyltransferase-2
MKILLAQTSFLGDTILSTPVIAGIKKRYPDSRLWMMTTPLAAGLVRRDPRLSGVIALDKRGRDAGLPGLLRMSRRLKAMQFDRVYSLHRSYRTSLLLWLARIPLRVGCSDAKGKFLYHTLKPRNFDRHDVLRNLSILSGEVEPDPDTTRMRLFAPPRDEAEPHLHAISESTRRYAVMAPGSVWPTKMWHWEGYRDVARYLLDRDIGVVLIGAASDRQVCAKIAADIPVTDLSGRTRIEETMTVVQNACLMICNDSMALHMASAMKIPTAVIFCATSPAFGYGPWQNRSIVIEKKGLDCKPCRRHGSLRCPNGTQACMQGPSAGVVIDAVRQLLETEGAATMTGPVAKNESSRSGNRS